MSAVAKYSTNIFFASVMTEIYINEHLLAFLTDPCLASFLNIPWIQQAAVMSIILSTAISRLLLLRGFIIYGFCKVLLYLPLIYLQKFLLKILSLSESIN